MAGGAWAAAGSVDRPIIQAAVVSNNAADKVNQRNGCLFTDRIILPLSYLYVIWIKHA